MAKTNTTLVALSSLQFMILSILIILFLKSSVATDTLTVTHSLSVGQTLISSGDTFELGFFSPGNSRKLYIGIWFKNLPWRKPVWVANRENSIPSSDGNSTFAIGRDGNLGLFNGMKNTVWSTNVTSPRINGTNVRSGTPSRRLLEDIWGHRINQNESSDLPIFNFEKLSAATNNFGEENKLGAGGFGPVYKGKLEDGQEIAVKRLSEHSGQGITEFKNEILLISKLKHRNLVTLHGYCIKGDEKLLVYEYLKNKSLDNILFDKKSEVQFDWAKRCDIIQGIARGLLYLHRDSFLRVIHRDLKASNILLDDQMNPKISDFGLARGFQMTQELANTHRVVGTFGYMSPEYALGGLFSEKSDVYSFGVLLLEIISGMKNTSVHYQENYLNLLGYAWHLWEEGMGLELMDKQIYDASLSDEFIKYMQIGLLCVQDHAIDRPTMSLVVLMLTSDMDISEPKKATFYQGLINSDLQSQSSTVISKNDLSLSIVEGR